MCQGLWSQDQAPGGWAILVQEPSKGKADKMMSTIKDPHVFPFIVKGFKSGGKAADDVRWESRRTLLEAEQSAERFRAEGFDVYLFEVKELEFA